VPGATRGKKESEEKVRKKVREYVKTKVSTNVTKSLCEHPQVAHQIGMVDTCPSISSRGKFEVSMILCVADERVEEKALGRDQKPQGL
jgi:hypothetical protein